MGNVPNIFQMYVANGCKCGFFITRNSWSNEKYAKVIKIDGVEEGKMIDGEAPYFTRYYPIGHTKAGKVWKRYVYLEAPWFDDGEYITDCGGNYSWARVFPDLNV
jgi:hypothetical protein